MLLAALSIQRIADEAGACEVLWCAEGAANNGSLYDLQTRVFRRVEAYGLAHWARARLARGETSAVAVAERLRERGRHAVTVGEDVVDLATHDAASRAYTLKPPSGCNVWEAALLEAIGGGARIEESTFSCEPLASPEASSEDTLFAPTTVSSRVTDRHCSTATPPPTTARLLVTFDRSSTGALPVASKPPPRCRA